MSQRTSGFVPRSANDYFTPTWSALLALLQCENFLEGSGVFDPCCGDGQIIRACRELGLRADGQDLHDYGVFPSGHDFLEMNGLPEGFSHIVTNPPYGPRNSLAVKFIEHSLKLVSPIGGSVIMLLTDGFDNAKGRKHLFRNNPYFMGELRPLARHKWTNLDHSENDPSKNHVWYVWDTSEYITDPVKIYLDPTEDLPAKYQYNPKTQQCVINNSLQ